MLMTMCDHARYNDEDYDSGVYMMDLLPIFACHYLRGDMQNMQRQLAKFCLRKNLKAV